MIPNYRNYHSDSNGQNNGLPLTLSQLSGRKQDSTSNELFLRRLARINSSPGITRHPNESFNSLNSVDSGDDSTFLRHKNSDSMNSTNTQVDDSPTKCAFNLNLKLPKLSIDEKSEFKVPPGPMTTAAESHGDNYFGVGTSTPSCVAKSNPSSSETVNVKPTIDSISPEWNRVRANSLINLNLPHAHLAKQHSSPTFKSFEMKKPHTDNLASILKLSDQIKLLDHSELAHLLSNVKIIEDLNLPNLIIIDIRSFADFVKSHIQNALNICLPSTLLKRSNFSFNRCVNSLPNYEKLIIKNYFNFETFNKTHDHQYSHLNNIACSKYGFPSILVYDNFPNSANVYHMLKKITDEFKLREINIFLVKENFNDLCASGDRAIEIKTGNSPQFNMHDLINRDSNLYQSIVVQHESPTSGKLGAPKRLGDSNQPVSEIWASNSMDSSTPILSNFKLPNTAPTPNFKIRHNEEVVDNNKSLGIDLLTKYSESELSKLPNWLPGEQLLESRLIDRFNQLEKIEKDRLNKALDIKNNYNLISSGIEKGYKNRYKDILLYEHSRVRLIDFTPEGDSCDYINASYIDSSVNLSVPTRAFFKYIAAQGPLKHTIGDFFKCILNNKVRIVISLTNQWENGMVKCEPYWEPGVYRSNNNDIKTSIESEEKLGNVIIRYLKVMDADVLQIQLLDWMDNDICHNIWDLIFIVQLKNHLITKMNLSDYNTLIHCSAGCGRTGTFITVDTIINLIQMSLPLQHDLIPQVVDNLRCQRISMVQNLRQFMSIYEILIHYFNKDFINDFNRDIINKFISQ